MLLLNLLSFRCWNVVIPLTKSTTNCITIRSNMGSIKPVVDQITTSNPEFIDSSSFSDFHNDSSVQPVVDLNTTSNPDFFDSSSIIDFPESCSGYTNYLKMITRKISEPQLVDIIPTYVNSSLIINIIFNVGNVKKKVDHKHSSYSLIYLKKEYHNLIRRQLPRDYYTTPLRFIVPTNRKYSQGEVIYLTIVDHKFNKTYSNVKACVKLPAKKRLPLVSCNYVSNYNSIDELRSFLAFQRIQKVSMVIWYMATPINNIYSAFSKMIDSGYLRLIDFTWPRVSLYKKYVQRSNQQAHMNSCFYRFKYDVEAMFFCDIDEYVFSEQYPFNLPSVVPWIQNHSSNYDAILVWLFFLFHLDDFKRIL